jgi:hypothetical protein
LSSLVEATVELIPVQIKAASLVTFANTGGTPAISKTGYEARDATEAIDESKPPAIPPTSKNKNMPMGVKVIDFSFSTNSFYYSAKINRDQ